MSRSLRWTIGVEARAAIPRGSEKAGELCEDDAAVDPIRPLPLLDSPLISCICTTP